MLDELRKLAGSLSHAADDIVQASGYEEWDNDLDTRTGAEELLREAGRLNVEAPRPAATIQRFDLAMREHAKEVAGTIREDRVRDVPPQYWWWRACAPKGAEDDATQE